MFTRSFFWIGAFLVSATFIFSGCQSSKVAYGNKYYFKQQPRTLTQGKELQPSAVPEKLESRSLADQELLASIDSELKQHKNVEAMMEKATQKLTKKLDESGHAQLAERVSNISDMAAATKDQSLTKREARNKRKEVRREIRELTKEWKATSPNSESFLDDLDPNLKKAIIFWALGLVLSIVASFVPFVWILASISWLVGTVFFILWLVEELE